MATTNTQPNIDIAFKQLVGTAIVRGGKGRVGLILRDDTDTTFSKVTYKLSSEIEKTKFTNENTQFIKDCFLGIPAQVTVIRIATDGDINDALAIVKTLKLDWTGTPVLADQQAIAQFVKEQEALKKTYKAVTFNAGNSIDSKQVVELVNNKVTFTDARGQVDGVNYVPSMLGLLAGLALNRSATYLQCSNLKEVEEVEDIDTSIQNGKLVLFNDDEDVVKISTAVNSLVTIDANNTLDMTRIEIVEIMNLMYNDIYNTFKEQIVGKYKNSLDRQYLFISSVNAYLEGLEGEELLDSEYINKSNIYVEAQRLALKTVKGDIIDTWTDAQVKKTTVGNNMYLITDVKMLGALENLKMTVNMF